MKKRINIIAGIVLLSLLILQGCADKPTGFGIYLVENGRLVLSDKHIKAYFQDEHNVGLNDSGVRQWNSFLNSKGSPKITDGLFNKEFVLKVQGQEIYHGKFYSGASSMSYTGVVILDTMFKMDSEKFNTLWVRCDNFDGSGTAIDPRNNHAILNFFAQQGKLK